MARKTYRFELAEHEEHGIWGFRPLWMPGADPLAGMGVAHDILEHGPKDDGSFADEMRALGASLWVRYEPGYWSDKYNPDWEFQISGDMQELLRKRVGGEGNWLRPDDFGQKKPVEDYMEEQIAKASARLLDEAKEEFHVDDHELVDSLLTDENLTIIESLWRQGAARAMRRYSCPHEALYMFQQIEEKADRLIEMHREEYDVQVIIGVDRSRAAVDFRTITLDRDV